MRLSTALSALLFISSSQIASSPSSSASLASSPSPSPTSLTPSSSSSSSTPPLSCLAANGSRVDWWFALKHPGGDRYSYLDSEDRGGARLEEEEEQEGLASASEGPLAKTLLQLYRRRRPDPGFPAPPLPWRVLWNDQPPFPHDDESEPYFYFAHSKGVLGIDSSSGSNSNNGGFFLSHSAPRFPNDPEENSYAGLLPAQQRFSQHFLCISLGASGMENLTRHLSRAFRPRAFSVALPPASPRRRPSSSLEAAAAFAAGALPLSPTSSAEVHTAAGEELLLLATAGAGGDGGGGNGGGSSSNPLWDSVVASAFAADAFAAASPSSSPPPPLAVQSWIRTDVAAPPRCRMPLSNASEAPPAPLLLPSVLGVRSVSFERRKNLDRSLSPARWSSELAHAKWAVALAGDDDDEDPLLSFACVGDTNRDAPERAGGAACARWPGLAASLAEAVEEVDACAAATSLRASRVKERKK